MVIDVFGADTLKFICYVTETVKGLPIALISNALEAIEFHPKSIDSSFFLSWNSFIDLFEDIP